MKKITMINFKWCYLLSFIVFYIGCKPTTIDISNYVEPKENINSNNKIYKEGVEVLFDYYFIQNEDTFKCNILGEQPMFQSPWELTKLQDTLSKKYVIDKIALEVTGKLFFDQTEISFFLLDASLHPINAATTWTGLIENEHRVWTHPNRMYQLNILEFNPFPEIQFPLQKGKVWTDTISPYPDKVYDRWIKFDERINCVSNYKIIGKTKLKTNLGVLTCYVTKSTAVNPYSKGYLTSYFNEKYGFVKLDYTNIDGSGLVMNMIDFKEKTETKNE